MVWYISEKSDNIKVCTLFYVVSLYNHIKELSILSIKAKGRFFPNT